MLEIMYFKGKILLSRRWLTIFERILELKAEIEVNIEKKKSIDDKFNSSWVWSFTLRKIVAK